MKTKAKTLLVTVGCSLNNVPDQRRGWAHHLLGSLKCLAFVLRDLVISPTFSCLVLVGDKPFLCIYLSGKIYHSFFHLWVSKTLIYCFERNMRLQSFLQEIFASLI